MDMSNERQIAEGDKVSYRGRQYKVRTVWGGGMAGQISILPLSQRPDWSGVTLNANRLVWSDTRMGGCWIVMKAQ